MPTPNPIQIDLALLDPFAVRGEVIATLPESQRGRARMLLVDQHGKAPKPIATETR